MKNKKTKLITLSLASVLGAATLFGGIVSPGILSSADDPESTVKCSDVFSTSNSASLDDSKEFLTVSFPNDDSSINLSKRDLALKWYEGANKAGYFSFTFKLENTNFATLSIVIETASAWATKDEKTANTVTFTNTDGAVTVKVNDVGESTAVDVAKDITIKLGEHQSYGAFNVLMNNGAEDTDIGDFTNIGANFAENKSEITPFTVKTTMPETEEGETQTAASIQIKSLNGQSFALTEKKLKDTALPVIVINDEVNGFMLGTQYTVTAEAVDVLDSSVSITTKYYQFNPSNYTEEERYKTMPSKPYLGRVTYEKDGKSTNVYQEFDMEYLSVKYTAKDDAHTEDVPEIELVWYAGANANVSPVEKDPTITDTTRYIKMDRSAQSPAYSCVINDEESKTSALDETNEYYKNFLKELETATKDLEIGDNTYVYLPTMKGLIDDDNGYKNLKFTVSYKTEEATSPTTVSISSASELKFSISKTGLYEFKIIASDQADNAMKAYLENEEVTVTTSNVWDIDAIPSFSFTVEKSEAISVEDGSVSDRKDTKVLDSTYTLDSMEILGVASDKYTPTYALFKISTGNYQDLDVSDLSAIQYSDIQTLAKEKKANSTEWANGDYIAFYQKVYAELLAKKIKSTATGDELAQMVSALTHKKTGVFTQIEEFDSRIDEDDHAEEWKKNNQYNWNASSASFTTAEEGTYLILAVYSDKDIASNKAAAYKVVTAAEKEDVIEGETEWLKNNLVSVILFGVAGVMLILIIILLFVKPSDETLEEVDAKALKTKSVKEKKKKSDE
ncbi:MAG: hypothetical protein IJ506_01230 [Clostridia bacterium]|nr:hypothetical protein [Clostridia bacterium]